MSTRNLFSQQKHCPVVDQVVTLHGVRVTLGGGPTAVSKKNCSNLVGCEAANGPAAQNARCLLHTLT
ncbi:protein of unknown function (plasmid) [Paraburkholderia kururiensis]|uniref:hypothetical protein n=1 Tax=Paraburkholderia kururiensis TaxID=984307 RepID=UPI0039A43704